MHPQVRVFGSVLMLAIVVDVVLTMRPVRGGRGLLGLKRLRWRRSREEERDIALPPIRRRVLGAAKIDRIAEADGDACAREAAAAIEAVLDRRCPELKRSFWKAVEKHYRLDNEPRRRLPAAPGPSPEARTPGSFRQGLPSGRIAGAGAATAGSRSEGRSRCTEAWTG